MTIPRKLQLAAIPAILALISTFSWAGQAGDGDRKIVVKTTAVYPTLAKSMNIHGMVKLEADVLPNGTVKSVEIKGGHPILTQSAVSAVERWKFEPAAHETKENVQIEFALQ